jgi:hypothetical protein
MMTYFCRQSGNSVDGIKVPALKLDCGNEVLCVAKAPGVLVGSRNPYGRLFGIGCFLALLGSANLSGAEPSLGAASSKLAPASHYGDLPLRFEANQGQTNSQVKFLSRGHGYSLFLTDTEAVLVLQRRGKRSDVVRMQLVGANQRPKVSGLDQLPGKNNYFIGNDPNTWHRNVPTYRQVSYREVYPGVDLVYYGNQKQLEYDFVIEPGANPDKIRLKFAGAGRLSLSGHGDLEIVGSNGEVVLGHPIVYQTRAGRKQFVEGHFAMLDKDTAAFRLGSYDHGNALTIDPTLTYSTYLGGSGFQPPAAPDCCGDTANGIAVDIFGSAYVVGTTGSTDFPVTGTAFQKVNNDALNQSNGSAANVFISKLDPSGSSLVYSTYLGGSGDYWFKDSGAAIAVDLQGNAYVTGFTGSSDFPITPGAFQPVNKSAANTARNAFVTKLTADGSGLIYSTYLGGSGFHTGVAEDGDYATGIAIDSSGDAFVVGSSFSEDFPVTSGAFQTTNRAWPIRQANPFVAKLNSSGTALSYATYLGGTGISQDCCYYFSGADYGAGIVVDGLGDAFVTGYAHSKDFPVTPSAYQKTNLAHNSINGTGAVDTNACVTEFNPSGTALIYSTYVGGSGNPYYGDQATGIAIDSGGSAYITGQTGSTDFPVTGGAFQQISSPYSRPCGFVTKVTADGSDLVYSTYLCGTGNYNHGDSASGIAVNNNGEAYIAGTAISWDFPVTPDAFQSTNNQSTGAGGDYYSGNAFITQLDAIGSGLVYSSYLGGRGAPAGGGGDTGLGIALDGGGDAYIAGRTVSSNFPVTPGAYQTSDKAAEAGNPGSSNAFVAEFGIGTGLPLVATSIVLSVNANPQTAGQNVTFMATVATLTGTVPSGNVTFKVNGALASIVPLNSSGQASYSTLALQPGTYAVEADYSGSTILAPSNASISETINANTVTVTFNTSPSGLSYMVDETTYSTPTTLTLVVGSTHTISISSPQGLAGTKDTFVSWSDGGTLSHTITVSASGTYTASFTTSYLLTIAANPASGGTVTPPSGTYYPASTSVALSASPNNGYAFSGWTGNVVSTTNASTTITMSAPETVTASFSSSGTLSLFGNITGKSGPTADRLWSIQLSNNGPGAALAAEVSSISFNQVGGVPCDPAIITALPASAGNVAPGSSAIVPIAIDFNGCAANSRFTVNISLSANAGNGSGSIVRLNQFQ